MSYTKVQAVKQQVDETKNELEKTLKSLGERGQKIEDLKETTDHLQKSAGVFTTTAKETRRNMCVKNAKMTIILSVTIVSILAIIIISLVTQLKKK